VNKGVPGGDWVFARPSALFPAVFIEHRGQRFGELAFFDMTCHGKVGGARPSSLAPPKT